MIAIGRGEGPRGVVNDRWRPRVGGYERHRLEISTPTSSPCLLRVGYTPWPLWRRLHADSSNFEQSATHMDVIKKGGAAGEGKRFVPAHVTHDAYVAMLHEKYDPKNTKAAKEQAAKEHVRTHACASQILGQPRLLTMERV